MKTCVKCAVKRTHTGFRKDSRIRGGYTGTCLPCHRAYRNASYLNNRDEILRKQKSDYDKNPLKYKLSAARYRLKNIAKVRAFHASYRKNNAGKLASWFRNNYILNRAKKLNDAVCWRKKNKSKVSGYSAARRAREINATPGWADMTEIASIYAKATAMSESSGIQHHVDHIWPLKGHGFSGLHVQCNLRILTASENLKKGNKRPEMENLHGNK